MDFLEDVISLADYQDLFDIEKVENGVAHDLIRFFGGRKIG